MTEEEQTLAWVFAALDQGEESEAFGDSVDRGWSVVRSWENAFSARDKLDQDEKSVKLASRRGSRVVGVR